MTIALHGSGISRGIAVGAAHIVQRNALDVLEYAVAQADVEPEVERLSAAVEEAKQGLRDLRGRIPANTPADIAAFLDTHLLMLEDPTLTDEPKRLLRERRCNAEWALKMQRDAIVSAFDLINDAYLRARRDDVDHVINRILRILLNHAPAKHESGEGSLEGLILVADDLTPADALLMQQHGIVGFVTECGGPTSHTAIIARSLGLPGVVGVPHARQYLLDGESLVLDGDEGVVLGDADARILTYYRARRDERQKRVSRLAKLKRAPAVTADGVPIELLANVELQTDFDLARAAGARGVGLYRTEFLYMNRLDVPSEAEHFALYKRLIEAFRQQPVTIRTLDLGADKQSGASLSARAHAANPALGMRAVRLGLKEPELSLPQLRAIVRASALGNVRLMIPMLSHVDEVVQMRGLIQGIQAEYAAQGISHDPNMPIGGMLEVPAAVAFADGFARTLDFLSIGTNDLIQYAVAIDRVNEEVSYLYDPLNPGVVRLIDMAIRHANAAACPIAMCGEMAGDPRYTRLLLGLGLRCFSVHPSLLLEVKQTITESQIAPLRKIVGRALRTAEIGRFRELMASLMARPV
ncbi:MAG: phosphoenolpyruvate--protein phosphotransferase [Gammaproteobacteria bacterium]|nr:phosphoenolpyruvate--protein phosphotransferase [Gammaproteobacteria bacterium]